MKTSVSFALGSCVAAMVLAGCGGSQPLIGAPGTTGVNLPLASRQTFHYTGKEQFFTVPSGVESIKVTALGAAGGGSTGGLGGRVSAVIPVVSGEQLAVFVGGTGSENSGGFNGGAVGGGPYGGYGGGGASDVRENGDSLKNRILVVGGGGGQGATGATYEQGYGNGGQGGARTGGAGVGGWCHYSAHCGPGGGGGGAPRHGGSGGAGGGGTRGNGVPGKTGSRGDGGAGGIGCGYNYCSYGGGGGGGGGGYYGGGGGGCGGGFVGYSAGGGGGGGGSSYIEPSARKYADRRGSKSANGNGLVIFSW